MSKIHQSIADVQLALEGYIRQANDSSESLLTKVPDFTSFSPCIDLVLLLVQNIEDIYTFNTINDELADDAGKFNSGLQDRTRDFILANAFQAVLHVFLDEYITTIETENLNKICLLLDTTIQMYKTVPYGKPLFFQLTLSATSSLFNVGTDSLSKFWTYLESRQHILQTQVFDQKSTADRISLLEICNGITDKYTSTQKKDSYKKDSFNNELQHRVRIFLTNIFSFEDNTGLNKYFSVSNRVVREQAPYKAKSWEDELLQDMIAFKKLTRDPYTHLRPANTRALTKGLESMTRLYEFLFEEEEKYHSTQPKVDQFAIKPKSEENQEYLRSKYLKKQFFPESFWLFPFEDVQRGAAFDEIKKTDEKYFLKLLLSSKTRLVLIAEIYLAAAMFHLLLLTNKRQLLKDIGAPPTTKHIVDDLTPDSLSSLLVKAKREITKKLRTVDSQLGILLQHLQTNELHWWGWLIHGKDSKGNQLFANRQMSEGEFEKVAQDAKSILPYKEKKYFNLYATPQLSRKMKVETGLDKLKGNKVEVDFEADIARINERLRLCEKDEKEELLEERTTLVWKQMKMQRDGKWLDMDLMFKSGMIEREREEETEVEEKEEEKIEEKVEEEEKVENEVSEEKKDKPEEKEEQIVDDVDMKEDEDQKELENKEEKNEEVPSIENNKEEGPDLPTGTTDPVVEPESAPPAPLSRKRPLEDDSESESESKRPKI